ncbi:unnamed protein product [Pelagomonas calceolata]|uniref:Ubiquitin-like domain-containing protein n=1 Tax=Pelagomonas calceolata TaxID=35677 RepID=A0A8J2SM27_9STRA|nr:unnamed protein product [Pelagomonas calceolata]
MGAAPAKPSRERVWVTGASGGLGEEVAAAYAARGCALVLSARRRRELDRVAARCREAGAPTAEVVPLDQGDGQSVERALRGALAAPLDVVVLCGGVGAVGSRAAALDTDAATLRRLMETNFLSTAELGRRCARHFLDKRRDGRVVVVSSVQGYFGLPQRAAYAASKHALHGYFDALRAELAAESAARVSVTVTVVAPGYIRTGHSLHALTGDGRAYDKNDAATASGADPAAVARALIDAADRRQPERLVAPGAAATLARLLRTLSPSALFALMARRAARARAADGGRDDGTDGALAVRVLRSTGDALFVPVARGSTVADLKAAIATALADAPAERQRLIFGGKPLEDGSLAASGLADGQTVHLALRPSSS